ncbi:MAG: ATP-binding protein [Sedimentisphaerales bacterium]|nr:ATP-binding protein [Sedimentisphaerales bacterium]
METNTEPVHIKEVLAQMSIPSKQNPTFGKCENCHLRPKHRDRAWCERCIMVWKRKQKITERRAEREICRLVEPLYWKARIDELPEKAQRIIEELKSFQDVLFIDPIGTGKTYAMAAMIRKYIYEGYECERINFDDFCVQVRSAMSPASKKTEWEMIEPLKHVDKLFIDDLGLRSKQETDFAYVTFYSLLNKRQERMLPTFISTNKSIDRLAQAFDARIASRLQTAVLIEMGGPDRRTKQ